LQQTNKNSLADLKNNKYHIIRSWILLLCFVAGQYMVYAHQHTVNTAVNKSSYRTRGPQPRETIVENCQLCDAMHHNALAINHLVYFTPVAIADYTYKTFDYVFISIVIIHSGGRSPPLV
jgi:hypothetical protein